MRRRSPAPAEGTRRRAASEAGRRAPARSGASSSLAFGVLGCLALAMPLFGPWLGVVSWLQAWSGVGVVVLIASVAAFGAFWHDKRAAEREAQRTPERVLLAWAAVGGWPGAWLARSLFRHKTRKQPFVAWLIVVTALNIVVLAGVAWLSLRLAAT